MKIPRNGTAARAVVETWMASPEQEFSWSDAERVYTKTLNDIGKYRGGHRERVTYNLSRLLKRYGRKLGPRNSRAKWKLGRPSATETGERIHAEVARCVFGYSESPIPDHECSDPNCGQEQAPKPEVFLVPPPPEGKVLPLSSWESEDTRVLRDMYYDIEQKLRQSMQVDGEIFRLVLRLDGLSRDALRRLRDQIDERLRRR